jgi:hypothetical protein
VPVPGLAVAQVVAALGGRQQVETQTHQAQRGALHLQTTVLAVPGLVVAQVVSIPVQLMVLLPAVAVVVVASTLAV